MKRGAYALLVFLMLLMGGTLYSLQLRLDMYKAERPAAEELMYLPRAEYLKVASLGYHQLVADLLWLKAIQHMGERNIRPEGYDWIYNALDTVTTLDPKFVSPYEVGGLILTVEGDKVGLSSKLLLKGMKNNPDYWRFPFYLGFNCYFFLKDYKDAARYMAVAAGIPGSPPYLPLLVSRLYVQAEDPEYALEFLSRMYENTRDEKLRESLLERINGVKSEILARKLQESVENFKKQFCRGPGSLKDLVVSGMVGGIPEDPAGGRFYIDRQGVVKSTGLKERLKVYSK